MTYIMYTVRYTVADMWRVSYSSVSVDANIQHVSTTVEILWTSLILQFWEKNLSRIHCVVIITLNSLSHMLSWTLLVVSLTLRMVEYYRHTLHVYRSRLKIKDADLLSTSSLYITLHPLLYKLHSSAVKCRKKLYATLNLCILMGK